MIPLLPISRTKVREKDRASLRTRLSNIPDILASLAAGHEPQSIDADSRFQSDPLIDALTQISPDEPVGTATAETSDVGSFEQTVETTGQGVVDRVAELGDLIDAEFTHMWTDNRKSPNPAAAEASNVEAAPVDPADRRRLPRHESGCVVAVCRCGQTIPMNRVTWKWRLHASRLKGDLLDISLTGLAIALSNQLPADEHILLQIRNSRLDQSIDCSARVIRTIAVDGGWRTVCEFLEPLGLETIHRVARRVTNGEII